MTLVLVIAEVLTGNRHTGTIVLANGVATVGKAQSIDHPPDVFGGLVWFWNGYFAHAVRVLIPKLPNAKGQAHQSHWGFFFCAIPLPDTIR